MRQLALRQRVEDLPILLTSAIRVSAPLTTLGDLGARKAATLRAVAHWMSVCPATRFVICDGSGYDLTVDLRATRSIDMSRVEVVTFENDRDIVRERGKGFGEGQIMNYAVENSAVLRSTNSFAKCTGKLWVDNFWSCRKAYNGIAGFSYFGFLSISAIDTRFFIVNKDFFRDKLAGSYTSCDDVRGRYLENTYWESLAATVRRDWMLAVYPRIRGTSGTSGLELRGSVLKQLGKNMAIRFLRSQSWARL